MNKVFVNGVNICYESVGEGVPLIGILGKDSNMNWWNPAMREGLSESNRFIMLDNRGTGGSDAPEEAYSISDMAKDVVGLMDALDIDKGHILGISMGGMIGQEIAIEFPNRVEKLVLCSTTCGVTRALPSLRMLNWMSRSRKSPGFSPQDTLQMLFSHTYIQENPDRIREFIKRMQIDIPNPRSVEIHQQAVKKFDSYDRLGRITAPTLILHGEEDWVFRPRHAKILNQRIAGSKLIMVPNAAHGIFSQEGSKVLEEIRRFIKK
ncbi:alpha/beta fold hydrolase [Paenibacillus jiagnxiensis]|uniref:alpha/beta fold hydrolase n=1 Tax=Paenibacillus jiagnxiensis TaxID=3228926 RepID=UPI0033A5FBE8